MTQTRSLVLVAALAGFAAILVVGGCASSKTHLIAPPISPEDTVADDSSTTLSVQNDDSPDMDVYVYRGDGMHYRLGMAPAHQTTVFVIPKYVLIGAVTDLKFVANPIAGQRAQVSETMSVSPGDQVDMIITPQ